MILFLAAANEETELITKKSQIEFARQLEKRNLKVDSIYIKQQYPAIYIPKYTELSTVLKQKGIYTMNFGCVKIEKEIFSKETGATQNCIKNVPRYLITPVFKCWQIHHLILYGIGKAVILTDPGAKHSH